MRTPKILFISHNAGRTGAPLVLLSMLSWFKKRGDFSFEILFRGLGSLQKDFSELAPAAFYHCPWTRDNLIDRYLGKPLLMNCVEKVHHRNLLRRYEKAGFDLIYSNTMTNGCVLETLAPLKIPVVTHVHELDYWIEMCGQKNLEQVLKYSNRFIAASIAVKENLVKKYNVKPADIDVVHGFIPISGVPARALGIRQQLGIPEQAFVVAGSGYETWRKGKDLFVQLAALVNEKMSDREVHFVWVGGWEKAVDRRNINHDVHRLGITDRVHFIGEVENPLDYFAVSDVFAMVSREDPFPLVCLESAFLGKPVVCFADAGGMVEFVEDDAGKVSPYLDLQDMAESIVLLAGDDALRGKLGKRASAKVQEHYCLDVGASKISEIIKKVSGCRTL